MIGASGALFALLLAYGMIFPDRIITIPLFFVPPVQMRARQLVVIFIALELLFLFRSGGGEIGRAHVCTPVTFLYVVCRLLLDKKYAIRS